MTDAKSDETPKKIATAHPIIKFIFRFSLITSLLEEEVVALAAFVTVVVISVIAFVVVSLFMGMLEASVS